MSRSYKKYPIITQEKLETNTINKSFRRSLRESLRQTTASINRLKASKPVKIISISEIETVESIADKEFLYNNSQFRKYKRLSGNYKYMWTRKQAIENFKTSDRLQRQYESLDAYIDYWKRCCLRK